MPAEKNAVLLANVTLMRDTLQLSKEIGACRSVRFRSVNRESFIIRSSCNTVMSAENGGSRLETLLMWSELSIVATTPAL